MSRVRSPRRPVSHRVETASLAAVLVAGAWSSGASAVAGVVQWTSPTGGSWSNGLNWSGGLAPNGQPVVIAPRRPVSVTFDLFNVQVPSLTIGGGSELLVPMSQFGFLGACDNDGTIRFTNLSPFVSAIFLTEDVDLVGNGTLDMGDNVKNVLSASQTGLTLRNTVTHTIRGAGTIGDGALTLVNDGLIEASAPNSRQRLLLASGDNVNNGTVVARGGGRLQIESCTIRNTPGAIMHADAGGVVELWKGGITNGTLTSDGSGIFRTVFDESEIANLTNETTIEVPTGTALRLKGTMQNDGLISAKPAPGFATVNCIGNVVLAGTGELRFTGSNLGLLRGTQPGATLTNDAGHTISGGGQFGLDELDTLVNRGLLRNDSGVMRTDLKTSFVNEGVIQIGPGTGKTWELEPSGFANAGTIAVGAFNLATMRDTLRQTAGSTRVDGTMTFQNGAFLDLEGGRLGGDGAITGNVESTGGVLDPSLDLGDAPRSLKITGNYTQTQGGTFAVQLASGSSDLVQVTGIASLDGAIAVDFAPGFVPAIGSQFTVLTAASVTGGFECIDASALGVDGIEVVVAPTNVTLVVTGAVTSAADLNLDGTVNAADLGILLGAWGADACAGSACCAPDLTNDGAVDAADLGVLLGQWQ
jgi:hypothetical protein